MVSYTCHVCRWVWVGVGYLIGCIIIFHIIIILAQIYLGPLDNSAAVLSEEALRVRDHALYGSEGRDGETVVNVDEKVGLRRVTTQMHDTLTLTYRSCCCFGTMVSACHGRARPSFCCLHMSICRSSYAAGYPDYLHALDVCAMCLSCFLLDSPAATPRHCLHCCCCRVAIIRQGSTLHVCVQKLKRLNSGSGSVISPLDSSWQDPFTFA